MIGNNELHVNKEQMCEIVRDGFRHIFGDVAVGVSDVLLGDDDRFIIKLIEPLMREMGAG